MSEFKYACPVCGQHMMCDSSQAGTQMECPTCFQKITVPQAPSSDEQKFIITGTKKGERPVPKIPEPTSSFIPAAKGFPGAAVVIIIFLLIGAAVAFVYRGTKFSIPFLGPTHEYYYPSGLTNLEISNPSPAKTEPPPKPVIIIFPASSGDNIALNKTASASSEQNGRPPSSGNDGDVQTRWCASNGAMPQWWTVDFGGSANVTNVQIAWQHTVAYKYVIEMSPDNVHWTVAVDKRANSTSGQVTSDNFSASGRYLRVLITGSEQKAWSSFYELRAFGSINSHGK
jgi:DNA-directed RNA polymerase subunit RPC12/RpoP